MGVSRRRSATDGFRQSRPSTKLLAISSGTVLVVIPRDHPGLLCEAAASEPSIFIGPTGDRAQREVVPDRTLCAGEFFLGRGPGKLPRGSMATAIDDLEVHQFFGRARLRGWLLFVVGLGAFAGAVALIDHSESTSESLAANGVKTPARVVSLGAPIGRLTAGSIRVQYSYANNVYRETINLDDTSPEFRVGEPVTIAVDAKDPRRVAIDSSDNISPGLLWLEIGLFLLGPMAAIIGIAKLIETRRSRRLARSQPWIRGQIEYKRPSTPGQGIWLYRLGDHLASRVLRGGALVKGRSELGDRFGRVEVDMVGEGPALLRQPGRERIVRVVPPRNRRMEASWNKQFGALTTGWNTVAPPTEVKSNTRKGLPRRAAFATALVLMVLNSILSGGSWFFGLGVGVVVVGWGTSEVIARQRRIRDRSGL